MSSAWPTHLVVEEPRPRVGWPPQEVGQELQPKRFWWAEGKHCYPRVRLPRPWGKQNPHLENGLLKVLLLKANVL